MRFWKRNPDAEEICQEMITMCDRCLRYDPLVARKRETERINKMTPEEFQREMYYSVVFGKSASRPELSE